MRGSTSKHRRKHSRASRMSTAVLAATMVTAVTSGTLVAVNEIGGRSPSGGAAAAATGSPTPARDPLPRSVASTGSPAPRSSAPANPAPLHVVSTTPSSLASGAGPIVVAFDAPLAADSPLPSITPATPGAWTRPTPTTLRFDPAVPFVPGSEVTVDVPRGLESANGGRLAKSVEAAYRVADGSIVRLQQLLAELGYLPLTFEASSPEPDTPAAQGAMAFAPAQGAFDFRFPSTPQPLAQLWRPGKLTVLTTGAVMAFENTHGLRIDGVAGPAVWSALLHDAVAHVVDPQPYSWAWTTMSRPETLRIWSDGEFVLTSKANTGIAAAPTPKGSWPVYSRFRSQTMQGTNPDGTKYSDPGVPYISYFNGGDAIHGFRRASYGSAQSLGCVELPYDAAARVWTLIDYGTVVTVTG